MDYSDLGIVVIGRNEGQRLEQCLRSLPCSPSPIVYVDSGSIDESVQLAKSRDVMIVALSSTEPYTAARARNAGFSELLRTHPRLKFVQFIDGDCELVSGWLEAAIAFLKDHDDVAVVCGRRRERNLNTSVYNRLCDDEWNTTIGSALFCGGDSMIRTEAFRRVGGFRGSSICGEEPELCVRLREAGWTIRRLALEMTLHDAAMTRFRQWWTRSVRGGFAFAAVSHIHRGSPCRIWQYETLRALFWGILMPLVTFGGALFWPEVLLLSSFYILQVFRIARQRQDGSTQRWVYACFMTLAKFPEAQGIVIFYARLLARRTSALIEYKAT